MREEFTGEFTAGNFPPMRGRRPHRKPRSGLHRTRSTECRTMGRTFGNDFDWVAGRSAPLRSWSFFAVTCNIGLWPVSVDHPFEIACRRFGRGFGPRAFALSKSGCRTFERRSSSPRRTVRARSSPPRRGHTTTRSSSTRCLPTRSEARRSLDRRGRLRLRRQTSTGRHRPG